MVSQVKRVNKLSGSIIRNCTLQSCYKKEDLKNILIVTFFLALLFPPIVMDAGAFYLELMDTFGGYPPAVMAARTSLLNLMEAFGGFPRDCHGSRDLLTILIDTGTNSLKKCHGGKS